VLLLSFAAAIALGFNGTFIKLMQQQMTVFNAILEKNLATGNFQGEFVEAFTNWEN
jgi:hypothetical protein